MTLSHTARLRRVSEGRTALTATGSVAWLDAGMAHALSPKGVWGSCTHVGPVHVRASPFRAARRLYLDLSRLGPVREMPVAVARERAGLASKEGKT